MTVENITSRQRITVRRAMLTAVVLLATATVACICLCNAITLKGWYEIKCGNDLTLAGKNGSRITMLKWSPIQHHSSISVFINQIKYSIEFFSDPKKLEAASWKVVHTGNISYVFYDAKDVVACKFLDHKLVEIVVDVTHYDNSEGDYIVLYSEQSLFMPFAVEDSVLNDCGCERPEPK